MKIVTYGDIRGNQINLCESHIEALANNWPTNMYGEELCQVQHGLHEGYCHRCQENEA